jgi:signal transduction histidine kinase/HPt (histidine-containing phosphotransfer) domain-containing protein
MLQQKLKILVIDDEELDRMALMRSVRKSGFDAEVIAAANESEGLVALQEHEFDCVFLDYNLTNSTGIDFLQQHRTLLSGAQVIMVTSQGDEKLAVDAMKLGVCDYMPKNMVNPDGIAQSLRYALRLRDAADRNRKIQEELYQSERRLDAVVDKSQILLFAVNSRREYTMFRGHCASTLGIDPNLMIGQSVNATSHLFPLSEEFFVALNTANQHTAIIDTGDLHLDVTCFKQQTNGEDGFAIMGIATDVTELKKNEQRLMNDLSLARETEKVKERFMANMSHEIRTPIHGIMSLTNILTRSTTDPEYLNYLNAVKKSADSLLVIVNDILDISKIEDENMTFESTVFNLREAMNSSCELFRLKAEDKGVEFHKQFSPELPNFVKGDPTRLGQIVNNLVNNAVKFTSSGSVTVSIETVESNASFTMVKFKVSDTGIGIPSDKIGSIFEKFTQAGDDITRKFGGTGLGLSIAKRLTELQGGMMTVESKFGQGTTFTFSISFEIPADHELPTEEFTTDTTFDTALEGIKVLVVEDNDINRLVINRMLKDLHIQAEHANNGLEALDMIRQKAYDLVLMDIEMPVMNGYDCVRELRSIPNDRIGKIPVIAMTAHASKTEQDKCMDCGVNEYISKPFNPEELKSKIAQMMDRKDTVAIMSVKKERITNLDYLKMLSDDSESFFREFIELFLRNTPETLAELRKQTDLQNWEGVRQAAHKVKPSLNYMGMKEAAAIAADVEKSAKELSGISHIPEKVKQLIMACDTAYTELQTEINNLK